MGLRSGSFLENCRYCQNRVRPGRQNVAECDKCGLEWGHRREKDFFPIGHRWAGESMLRNFLIKKIGLKIGIKTDRLTIFYALAAMHREINERRGL